MDCRILRQITLKADGHLGCDDSLGYKIDLGHVLTSRGWRLRNVLNGPIYTHVRSSFATGRVPWPGVCEKCDLFSDSAEPVDTLNHRINLLVEPTLACDLSCACCIRKQIISNGRDTTSLDPAILSRLIDSCRSEGIAIGEVSYIGQGEPLMHDNFHQLFDIVKSGAPLANQIATTTGNIDFWSTVGDAALDRLIVSCDGPRQEVYQRYRRGGNLDTVIKFMSDCKRRGSPELFLEWKYILFEFNDSDEDLIRAQAIADDIGVDSLLFIITNSKWCSRRFTVDNIHEFPLRSLVARVNPCAAMNVTVCESSHFIPLEEQIFGVGYIDICAVSAGKMLSVEGWAVDKSGEYANHLELVIDGKSLSKTRTIHQRMDVSEICPAIGVRCGFSFQIPINIGVLPQSVEVRIFGASGLATLGGLVKWRQPGGNVKQRFDLPALKPESYA
jgi:organic radical activating enzyme